MTRGWRRLLLFAGVMLLTGVGQALAVPYTGNMVRMQDLLNGSGNFQGMALDNYVASDGYWSFGGSATATILLEVASFRDRNAFGVFSGNNYVEIFSGAQGLDAAGKVTAAGNQVTLDFAQIAQQLGSTTFGFYLQSPQGTFYSDTARNVDKVDHMVSYLGQGDELILGFEDLRGGGDFDYDDLVISLNGFLPASAAAPVPEPGTILLIGSGLLGFAVRKRKSA